MSGGSSDHGCSYFTQDFKKKENLCSMLQIIFSLSRPNIGKELTKFKESESSQNARLIN